MTYNTHDTNRISMNDAELARLEAIPRSSRTYAEKLQLQYMKAHAHEQRYQQTHPEAAKEYDWMMRVNALTEKNSHERYAEHEKEVLAKREAQRRFEQKLDSKRRKYTEDDLEEEFEDIEELRRQAMLEANNVISGHARRATQRLVSSNDMYK